MYSSQELTAEDLKYLRLLSKRFPNTQAVSTEIINLMAIMDLPKGTEHFMSDIHGEDEAFLHILNNASGIIREKVDLILSNSIPSSERAALSTLIYYPESKLELVKQEGVDMIEWYRITLHRLIDVCRLISSKYTRSKVRKALPADFAYIIDELLHTNYDTNNKEQYYNRIISTIVDIGQADAFIEALSAVIKRLAVDHLHIIGDIFDRGPRADKIMDMLQAHHAVDIQWGNHDVLWLGAAAGSPACIASVLVISLKYSNLDMLESGYGISLRHLMTFAQEVYSKCDTHCFQPKVVADGDKNPRNLDLVAQMLKAMVIIQFKLEGQIIRRRPDFKMEDRLLLDKIDYDGATIPLPDGVYPLRDVDFPTVDPADPYTLTEEEQQIMDEIVYSFCHSDRLQEHMRFLLSSGEMYKCYNENLLFHGCVPMEEDGSFSSMEVGGVMASGMELMNQLDQAVRQAYFIQPDHPEKQEYLDWVWYLWCGRNSPVFGRDRMTTFERYLIADKLIWKEPQNAYYVYTLQEDTCRRILEEFGLDADTAHIINGHVPVRSKDGESPIKAGGKLIVIDGGFCRAYQHTTGLAGYTLVYNSYGLRLISHQPFESKEHAIHDNTDILSTSTIFETLQHRRCVADTDIGKDLQEQIDSLSKLLYAYQYGYVKEIH